MLNLESAMLNALLDRYERSRGFKENRSQQRRIQLRMYVDGKTDFPAYDIEDSSARTAINEAAKKLAEQGVIELEWMHGQEGHILRRIALRPQALADAYHRGGRKPLADTAGQLAQRLRQVQQASSAPWARRYLQEELDFLEKNRRPRAAFPAEAAEQKDWLAVLEMLGTRAPEPPLLERVFSLRCLGNSKAFEKYHRARLLGVLRKALPLDTEEMNEEELLRQSGLEKYPEWFSFCGAVRLTWPDGKALDIAPLGDGVQISAVDASQVQISFAPQVRCLLFVENKANYFDTIRKHPSPERVVVFHGGCYSPQRGRFFQQLCRAAGPQVQLLHWGDIDCGGFQMDSRLRREIDPRIRPWRMDVEQFRAHQGQAEPFSEAYAAKLEPLLQDPWLQDSREVIQYMLRYHLRLEQEALLEG